jgi:hypothetical protein
MIHELGFNDNMREEIKIQKAVKAERERIIELIKGAPISFEWFQPFVATKTLIDQINEGQD